MREAVDIQAVRSWLGTPYVHQGRLPGVGLDCLGLVICLARETGYVAPDFDVGPYSPEGQRERLVEGLAEHLVEIDDPVPGCFCAFEIRRRYGHIAVCAGDTLIHTSAHTGKVVEHGFNERWRRRLLSSWTWRQDG